MNKIKLIAIIGKAGSGKDTVCKQLVKTYNYHKVIPYTTRPKRENEVEGEDYFFLSLPDFLTQEHIDETIFNVATFNDWKYGYKMESFSQTEINVGVFNITRLRDFVFNEAFDVQIVEICANNKIRMLRQLNREEFPDVDEIVRRYTADNNDFALVGMEFDTMMFTNDNKNHLNYIIKSLSPEELLFGQNPATLIY